MRRKIESFSLDSQKMQLHHFYRQNVCISFCITTLYVKFLTKRSVLYFNFYKQNDACLLQAISPLFRRYFAVCQPLLLRNQQIIYREIVEGYRIFPNEQGRVERGSFTLTLHTNKSSRVTSDCTILEYMLCLTPNVVMKVS